jgi:Lrp/AsnC family leucine-responsive transcriptional regulator/Lrp/AsnC family transcriptional regulator
MLYVRLKLQSSAANCQVAKAITSGQIAGGAVDEVDRNILVALQKDGRQTIVNLSKSTGSIRGYEAVVDRAALRCGQLALIAVQVRHSSGALEHFEQGILKVDGIKSCYRVSGRYDYILRAEVEDVAHVGLMTKNEIAAIDSSSRIETMVVFATVKSENGWLNEGHP